MSSLTPDLGQAQQFLRLLDPDAEAFTFQTFDDSPLKRGRLAKVCHGSLEDHAQRLVAWSKDGAGIFVMVNEGDGMGRKAENVTRVRCVWVDLDGSPLQPVLSGPLEPHVIVELSPGRWHCYWIVDGLALEQFAPVQRALADRFNGDRSVADLSRVMRMPAFPHQKAEPFLPRVTGVMERMPYTAEEILAAFPPTPRVKPPAGGNGPDTDPLSELVRQILTGESYHTPLCALAWRHINDGMDPGKVVLSLRALMENSEGPRDDRWCARYEEIGRAVSTAQEKLERQDDGDAWAEPDLSTLSDHRLPAPALPLEVFGDYWAGWISTQAEAKSCAPDYVAAGLLAGAGALIGNARWSSPWPAWAEPPVLWFAGVGTPSSGKSPGLDAPRDILAGLEAEANAQRKEELLTWDTAARAAKLHLEVWEGEVKVAIKQDTIPPLRPDAAEAPERPARRRIITNDATIEKIARIVVENSKGLLLFRDELAGWIGALDRYGGAGSDRAFFIEAYGGRPYAVDRVKDPEPIVVPALTVTILGGIQPDRLNTMILSGDDDGLAARIIYVWPERVPPRRPTCLPPTGAQAKLALLYGLQGERDVLQFSAAAASALQAYREQVAEAETTVSGLFLSWLGKLPGMVVRLANVLEHLYWVGDRELGMPPTVISERAAIAAIAFLDSYAVPMARRCFGEAALPQADRDAIALARWIKAQAPIPDIVNARELRRRHAPIGRSADRYDPALAELAEAGWLRRAQGGSGAGRPSKDWAVNPKLGTRS